MVVHFTLACWADTGQEPVVATEQLLGKTSVASPGKWRRFEYNANQNLFRQELLSNNCFSENKTMQLEDYFDFLAPNDIRIKGSRIGIESVLYEYIHNAKTPEEIDAQFWSINLEHVYATILYYLHNKEAVHQYVADWLEYGERMRAEQEKNPPPVIQRLRKLRQQYGDNIDLLIAERRAQYQIAEQPVEYRIDEPDQVSP
jgi:uncharacterized protein (DUF433 family)